DHRGQRRADHVVIDDAFIRADAGLRQLHARFADAVWRQDAAAFAQCFARDGEWKIAQLHFRGREDIEGKVGALLGYCERITLITGQPLFELTDEGATGRVAMTELAKVKDGSSAMTLGIYYDRYVEEDGRWRFRWRHWGLHYRGPIDLSAEFVPCPDYGPPPGVPGPDEPTYTRRAPVID
ncbi:MAG: nuclear transport factor 2 family protein, partial [Novosphingobium sp.]